MYRNNSTDRSHRLCHHIMHLIATVPIAQQLPTCLLLINEVSESLQTCITLNSLYVN